jgi:site-specific recombinase XerD
MSSRFETGLHEQFLQHGLYLRNWSNTTIRTYRQGLACLGIERPTKADLEAWVVGMRQRGLTPGGCNMYIRTVNSYLSWLRLLRAPLKQPVLLSPQDIKTLVLFRPTSAVQFRTWALIQLLLDTGVRIEEALGIEHQRVDLDNLTLVVFGKGRKERTVPFSLALRRVLFRSLARPKPCASPLLFSSRSGSRLLYRNAYREIQTLCKRVGIKVHCHPHLLRHQFAANYIREGGDIYRLSRLLGHTTVTTTQSYLRALGVEDFRVGHERLTPLATIRTA